ncbi:MAG: glycine/sarcosine/betaine reductase complex component C subunit beta [Egibacteraceae bacterium]
MTVTVIPSVSAVLAHTPGLARHGSKPARELARDDAVRARFLASLRSFEEAVGYPPHQAFLGALHPRDLPARPRVGQRLDGAERFGGNGELMPEEEFLGLLAIADDFDLLTLDPAVAEDAAARLGRHPLAKAFDLDKITKAAGDVGHATEQPGALALHLGADRLAGAMQWGHEADEALTAQVLLENLAGKATGVLALARLLHDHGIEPGTVDYVLSCSEEAVGDRYQRGGGNLAKAIAETVGLTNASGVDVKNFCAAPLPALVIAASLVASGVFGTVAIVAGGSMPKLGMKFQGHLSHDLPVLEDVMGGMAALVTADDGASPHLRLDTVGRHPVGAGSANQNVLTALTAEPLERVGLGMTDVDDYATELHDPEVTEPQGSGDVAARNYKTIAALAVRRGELERADMEAFVTARGMPGFAPTQGHLASALCYLPHALRRLTTGDAQRVQLLAKGSLFLGRMSRNSDGMSVVLERNPLRTGGAA